MSLKYPELFKSFNIGNVIIKNKVCMSPMLASGWFDENAIITDEIIDYYEERAKGGVGAIFTSGNAPDSHLEDSGLTKSPFAHPGSFIYQMKKLTDRVHIYDTKLFIQLWFGSGRVMFPQMLNGAPIAPSAGPNRWNPSIECREMTTQEIYNLINATIAAAVICQQTGCDGIDINGAYGGYLGDQFTTEAFNRRTDEFGGGVDGQIKILTDIVKGIKEKCGKDFPVTCRFGTKHYIKAEGQSALPGEEYNEFGRDIELSIIMAKKLENAGYDAFLMGNGSYDSFYWLYPPMYQKEGLWLEDIAKITPHVTIPVIAPGKILQPQMANDAIKEGKVDAVAIGRGLLAEPEWVNKAKLGMPEAIRPCIGCNAGCIGRIFAGLPMQCAVNADLFCEKAAKISPTDTPKRIAIIGGGIAGMECARIAAKRGHNVTIYEEKEILGGVTVAASIPEFKDADRRLLKWYERELDLSGVKVVLNKSITLEDIEELNADEYVVATGTMPKTPPIPGIQQENVVSAIDTLLGKKKIGNKVVVIGGGQVGCEIALWLQEQGKQTTLVEAMPKLLCGGKEAISIGNQIMLEDMLAFNKIKIMCNTKVKEIVENEVKLETSEGELMVEADSVIIAIGYNANDTLYRTINTTIPKKVWCLGDAKTPANIMFAVKDGNAIGKLI